MPYTPKPWANLPSLTTPISGAALQALERRAVLSSPTAESISGPGAEDYASYRVQSAGGMVLSVGIPSGRQGVVVPIVSSTGELRRFEGAVANVTIPAADATNPRLDQIVAQPPVDPDSTSPLITVVLGTPTGGATLSNRTGAAALPANSLRLADVLVGAGVVALTNANIQDRRAFANPAKSWAWNPSFAYVGDAVTLMPAAGLSASSQTVTAGTVDTHQAAALFTLPQRIVGATKIRWRYRQGATAATSNWVAAIFDATGRLIIATGATAFTGGINVISYPSATITATTFEPGNYYGFIGIATMTGSSAPIWMGVPGADGVGAPGTFFRIASGGTTVPANLDGLTDVWTQTSNVAMPPVPIFTLTTT